MISMSAPVLHFCTLDVSMISSMFDVRGRVLCRMEGLRGSRASETNHAECVFSVKTSDT